MFLGQPVELFPLQLQGHPFFLVAAVQQSAALFLVYSDDVFFLLATQDSRQDQVAARCGKAGQYRGHLHQDIVDDVGADQLIGPCNQRYRRGADLDLACEIVPRPDQSDMIRS